MKIVLKKKIKNKLKPEISSNKNIEKITVWKKKYRSYFKIFFNKKNTIKKVYSKKRTIRRNMFINKKDIPIYKFVNKAIFKKLSKSFNLNRTWALYLHTLHYNLIRKHLTVYSKGTFIIDWLTTLQLFSKSKLLPGLLRNFAKKQFKIKGGNNALYKHEKVTKIEKLINFRTSNLDYVLRKTKKKNLDFFSTYYGKVLFGTFISRNERDIIRWNDNFGKTMNSFNKTRFIKEVVRSNAYSQLTEDTNRFISDKFLNQNIKKTLGNEWIHRTTHPWLDNLIYERDLYVGSVQAFNKYTNFRYINWRHYLRYKNPKREKRNQLYNRFLFLLPTKKGMEVNLQKKARIKQILSKIVLPFYGNVSRKQFVKITKKTRNVKSVIQTKQENLLSRFERRLDIVVFRLNLAPNIFWARRMISAGNIFINSSQNNQLYNTLQGLKKNAFPLKLRDPKKLYYNNGFKYFGKMYKNFTPPVKNPGYLLSKGDVIQSSPISSIQNAIRFNPYLFKKPIPKHLLTIKPSRLKWNRWQGRASSIPKNIWDRGSYQPIAAVMLFEPTFNDLFNGLSQRDRSNESFLKWMSL